MGLNQPSIFSENIAALTGAADEITNESDLAQAMMIKLTVHGREGPVGDLLALRARERLRASLGL